MNEQGLLVVTSSSLSEISNVAPTNSVIGSLGSKPPHSSGWRLNGSNMVTPAPVRAAAAIGAEVVVLVLEREDCLAGLAVQWAMRGSNPRPHGCDPCALAN